MDISANIVSLISHSILCVSTTPTRRRKLVISCHCKQVLLSIQMRTWLYLQHDILIPVPKSDFSEHVVHCHNYDCSDFAAAAVG